MPYIAINAYPKDEATKLAVVEKISQIFWETWGCPHQAITISEEELAPKHWQPQVVLPKIEPKQDKIVILNGEKR